jgi:CRP-like cAMP-binding protein
MVPEEYYQKLISGLSVIHGVSETLIKALRPIVRQRTQTKSRFLLNSGDVQQSIVFLLDGYIREIGTNSDNGEEETFWFWFSGDFVFQQGFIARQPSLVDIEIYGGSQVLEISHDDLMLVFKDFPELYVISEKLRLKDCALRRQHQSDLIRYRREEHFKKFYSSHHSMFNVARHRDIASYLGIRNHGLHRYLKNQ